MDRFILIMKEILRLITELDIDPYEDRDTIFEELVSSGFDVQTVESAWRFFFSNYAGAKLGKADKNIPRIFHTVESVNMTAEAQGLLYDLYLNGYLSINSLEDILEIIRISKSEIGMKELVDIMDQILGFHIEDQENQPISIYLN